MLDPMPVESTRAYRQKHEQSAAQIRRANEAKVATDKSQQKIEMAKLIYLSVLIIVFAVIVGFTTWTVVTV